MTFYEKYLIQCKTRNISPSAAAEAAGFTRTSVTRWKKGSKPTDSNVLLLAEYFGCNVTDLKDDDEIKKEAPVQVDERKDGRISMLVDLFERLPPEEQNDVIFELLQKAQAQLNRDVH